MKKQIDLTEQILVVKTFLTHNCNTSLKINYKKTSHLWAMEVAKWAGVEISIRAFETACNSFDIKSIEISKGVNCFGIETIK